MQGLNRTTIIGNCGNDPELSYTQGGSALLKLRIAVNERVKRGGEWTDHVEWFSAVVWGKRAEGLSKVLSKGAPVLVEGPLRRRTWEDRNGNQRESFEVNADNVLLLGSGARSRGEKRARDDDPPPPPSDSYSDDDDIPF